MRANLAPPSLTVALVLAGMATPAAALGHGVHDGHGTPVACSTAALISAIETANADGGATLSLAKNCDYQLTSAYDSTDSGLPGIAQKITIKGNGATIERTGGGDFRVLEVDAPDGDLTAYDLTIKGGSLTSGFVYGAGVRVQRGAEMTLIDSTVTGNTITSDGGGGGVANHGRTTLTNTTITGNTAGLGGGVYNTGTLYINKNSQLNNNHANFEGGGGLRVSGGTVEIDRTTIDGNSADDVGGGVSVTGGQVECSDCTITNNKAANDGGGLNNLGKVVLRDVRVEDNSGGERGGGVHNLGLLEGYKVTVTGNTATNGGGVANDDDPGNGVLILHDSKITGNTAQAQGGGLENRWSAKLIGTTVGDNTVTDEFGRGAGIYNDHSVILDDGRVKDNKATGASSLGGGIYNETGDTESLGNLQLIKTKITGNSAGATGGVWTGGQFNIFRDSAIYNNAPTNCTGSSVSPVLHCTN